MAPAPAPAPATVPTVGVEDEGARGQNNNMVVAESEDVSMGAVKDDANLPVPCSEPASGPEVAPEAVEDKGGDTTESSSSFGDTFSGLDDEAEDGEPEKKKVTAEWRNATGSVMWRFKWLQLRIKELSSQVSRYDRGLAQIEKEKELRQAVCKTNGSMPDAMPIGEDHRNSSMKRRVRKRHEDIEDTSLYIKKHPILSYYNDKQSKGAETDGHLLDDDCGSPGGLDIVTLLDAEEYDTIFEEVALRDILSRIDGLQSQVHLLQDRRNKAHLEEHNLAFSEDSTHVRVPRKRKRTQKFCDTTYLMYQNTKPQKYRNARPQKKKNLNVLLNDNDGQALAVRPTFPDRGTDCQIEDSKGNSAGKSGEWNRSQDRSITMGLLLGVDNSLPDGHMGDLCKENADAILIDNRTANEESPQFEKIEHLPSETSSKGRNTVEVKTSAPVEVDSISSPLKVDSTSDRVINQEPLLEKAPMLKPMKKRGLRPKERNIGWGSASSSMNYSKGASTASDSEQKSKGAPPSAKEKTESILTAPVDPEIMTPLAAWKKRKAGNKSASAEEHKAGNLVSKNEKTGKSSSAAKEEAESSSKPMIEKAVLVTINSRRSQRVRKPKVY